MANALFLSPYWSDLATISASTTSGELAATNMQTSEPTQRWTSTAGSGSYIDLDFGASGAIAATALGLINLSIANGNTWSVFASNTSNAHARAGSGATFVSAASPYPGGKTTEAGWPYHIGFAKWANSTAYRYWSVTFPTVTGFSVSVGRLMLGEYLQPTINLDQEIGRDMVSADNRDRTAYNKAMLARRGNAARLWAVTYSHVEKAEAERGFYRLGRLRGNGGDFLFCLDPDETTNFPEYTMQCTFESLSMPSVPWFDGSEQMYGVRTQMLEVV